LSRGDRKINKFMFKFTYENEIRTVLISYFKLPPEVRHYDSLLQQAPQGLVEDDLFVNSSIIPCVPKQVLTEVFDLSISLLANEQLNYQVKP
jgi:hypothetical protein